MIKTNLPKLLKDNDAAYLNQIQDLIFYIDDLSITFVTQGTEKLVFHIKISHEKMRENMIKALKKYHKERSLSIYFSKSVNISTSISYSIKFG